MMMEQVEPKSPKQAMPIRRMPSTRKEREEIHSGGSWGGKESWRAHTGMVQE